MAAPSSPFMFPDVSKFMASFNLSDVMAPMRLAGVDMQDVILTQQRNFEAVARAQQVMLEGAQAVTQRQVEILRKAMEEATGAAQNVMKEGDPKAGAGKRVAAAKSAFERSIDDAGELSEIAGKANAEAMEIIKKRALAAFDEIKKAVDRSGK